MQRCHAAGHSIRVAPRAVLSHPGESLDCGPGHPGTGRPPSPAQARAAGPLPARHNRISFRTDRSASQRSQPPPVARYRCIPAIASSLVIRGARPRRRQCAMTAMSASGDDQPPEVTAGLPPSAAHSSAGMPAGPLPEGARCLTQFIWLLEHVQDAVTWHRQQARSGSYERTAFGTTNRLDRSPRPVSRSRPCAHNDLSVRPQRRDRPTGLARIAAGVCALAANQLQSLSVIGTPLRRVPYRRFSAGAQSAG